jgi:hypothetical protein
MRFALCLFSILAGCEGVPPADFPVDTEAGAVDGKADQSLTWLKVLTCDNGAAVLDVNANERRNVQFVIRDQNIVGYLNNVGAVHSSYGAREVIASGWTGYVDWSAPNGPAVHGQPYGGPGIFYQSDFREIIADYNYYGGQNGSFTRVFRDGAGMKIQYGQIEQTSCLHTSCEYVGDGFGTVCNCDSWQTRFTEKANWYFGSCQ